MDMGSLLGTILWSILNCKRTVMSTVKHPLIKLILTVAHIVDSTNRGTPGDTPKYYHPYSGDTQRYPHFGEPPDKYIR